MVKRMFSLVESDYESGITPGSNLMKEVDWCRNALGGVSLDLVPDQAVSPVKEDTGYRGANQFDFSEGTRPVVENMIEALDNYLRKAKNTLDPESFEAAEEAYGADMDLLKSIVKRLSQV